MGSTVEQFFEAIERESKEGKTLPVWYVVFHPICAFLFIVAGVENCISRYTVLFYMMP